MAYVLKVNEEVIGYANREKEPENGRPNRRRNKRRLIPSGSIASKWKHGDARVKRSSKASCFGKWSVVAGADESEWGRTLNGEEEGRDAGAW